MSNYNNERAAEAGGALRPEREALVPMVSALERATEAVTGTPNGNPLEVFPDPKEADRWADVQFTIQGDTEGARERAFRKAMAELGPGREEDHDARHVGLHHGYAALIEGGQPPKMIAELDSTMTTQGARPGVICLAASPDRNIQGEERAVTARVMRTPEGEVGQTEYDVARQLALRLPGLQQTPVRDLGVGFDMDGSIRPGEAGQLLHLGNIGGSIPVILIGINREYYIDNQGAQRYRQLDDRGKMLVVARLMERYGLTHEIGFVTSATYEPSRAIDASRVGEESAGMIVRVISYGAARLAAVRGDSAVKPPSLGQLAGQAYQTAQRLAEAGFTFGQQAEPESP